MSPSHRQFFSHLHCSICASPSLSWKAAAGPCTDAGPLRESHAMLQVHHWIRMWIFSRIPTLVFCMPMTMVVAWVSFVVDPPTSTPTFFRPCSNDPPLVAHVGVSFSLSFLPVRACRRRFLTDLDRTFLVGIGGWPCSAPPLLPPTTQTRTAVGKGCSRDRVGRTPPRPDHSRRALLVPQQPS